jgi:hypothetical protein
MSEFLQTRHFRPDSGLFASFISNLMFGSEHQILRAKALFFLSTSAGGNGIAVCGAELAFGALGGTWAAAARACQR